MSRVSIPAAAQPGQLTCDLELDEKDAQVLLDKLKAGVHKLRGIPAGHVPAGSTAAAPPATSAHAAAAPAAPPYRQQPPGSAAAAPPAALAVPAQQQHPGYAAMPGLPPHMQGLPVQAPAAPASAPGRAAAPTPAAPAWQLCWTSDAEEHSWDAVTGLVHVPQLAGLAGGDGHAGWLISCSKGLLNLWEASPSGGRGEPALMCMHSQATDYSYVSLDSEPATRLLLAASQDSRGAEWLTCSSLEAETLLAPKGRCPMLHTAASRRPGQNCLAAASLHSFGGPLAQTCTASYGGGLVVWRVGSASQPGASNAAQQGQGIPKALWKAHDSLITCLHKSAHGLALFSGAADGSVHLFNMREKPTHPNAAFTHQGRVAGIHQLDDTQLLTAGGDGRLAVGDLRKAAAGPFKSCIPDGRPILRMAVSPFGDRVALATAAGLHSVDLLGPGCASTPIAVQLASPATALTWNTATAELIVAGGPGAPGTVSVYRQRLADA